MIRIIIADDHDIVREGLRRILETYPEFAVAAEAATGQQALDACARVAAEVLLLDLDMPEGGGLSVLQRVFAVRPGIRVLVLTMHEDEEYAVRAMRQGAAGFLLKASPPGELPEAIRKVAAGGRFVSRPVMEKIADRLLEPGPAETLSRLSTRELQILARLGKFLTLQQIADDLALSISAVSTYKRRLMEKLDIHSNADLHHFIQSRNILDRDIF